MPRSPVARTTSSPQVLQTLAWLRKNEFLPVPLHPRSKAAISRDYAQPDYKPPTDVLWQKNDYGVGVVLGPLARGPVDIDLDCVEAVFFAPLFLPPTPAIFGRASKRASHYLYRTNASALQKMAFLDPLADDKGDATIVELRADSGHQTVLPGSLHEDTGELIEWHGVPFPDVPTVEADVLLRAVRRIALATLISRHIWHEGQRNELLKPLAGMLYYLDWTEDEALQLIDAVTSYTGDDDKTRRRTVSSTWKKGEKGTRITGSITLRRLLDDDRLVDKLLELAGSPTVNLLQEYNERFAVVSVEGKFRVADLDVPPGEPPVFMLKDDFLNLHGTDYVTIDDKPVPKPKLWLANSRRRFYGSVDFLPGADDNARFLNLWTGWALAPTDGDCSAWTELLRDVVCGADPVLFDWMMHWFASIFRDPQTKALTAPVIIGRQGAGKSLLLAYVGRILGPGYTVITNEEHIYGKFNRHLATTLLLHSEEALYGGDKKHRGIIKSLVTDEFRMFEQKGVDARQVRNFLRLILTSNEAHAAPAEANDRRFTVIDMGDRMASRELIDKVVKEMKSGGPAALFKHFVDMDYNPEVARTNIKNDALATMQGINMSPVESWWLDNLNSGYLLPDYLAWASRGESEHDPWPRVVSSSALYLSMTLKLQQKGIRQIPNETLLALHLNKFTNTKLGRAQKWYTNPLSDEAPAAVRQMSNRHNSILNMPNLEKCRIAFEFYMGQKFDWPKDAPDDEKPAYEKF